MSQPAPSADRSADRSADHRHRLVAAAYVILRRDDDVLLQLRRGTGYMDEHWAVLAGHLERGESAFEAAARESFEEAGVVVETADLRPLTTLHRYQPDGPALEQRCDFFFEARRWAGAPRLMEPARCADVRWFALDALPDPVVPHEHVVLDHLRAGRPVPSVIALST